jgi:hypothetical protein
MEVVDAQTLRYDEFCARVLATNTPVKLRNVASKWFQVADAQWRCAHDGSINFDALKVKYGHAQVPVCVVTCPLYCTSRQHARCVLVAVNMRT